ncbi:MAG TPA: hypothetical protein VD931_13995 [Baekduia sp.]|nr:hypothetical protein [Baekduia sp.]
MSATLERPPAAAVAVPRPAPRHRRTFAALVGRGLLDQRRAPLTWGGGLGAMTALIVAIWPSVEGSVDELLESYPQGLKDAFGIGELDSVEAYVDAEMFSLMIPLAVGFLAIRAVTRMLVGAEDRGHLDTLLSLPLSRRVLVAAAMTVAGLVVAAVLAVVWALSALTGLVAGVGMDEAGLAAGVANVWPLAFAFAGVAAFACGLRDRQATVTAIATGTLVAMYVFDLLGKLTDSAEPLRTVSAFRLYGSAIQDGLDPGHIAVLVLAGTALAWAGAVLFDRRDIH